MAACLKSACCSILFSLRAAASSWRRMSLAALRTSWMFSSVLALSISAGLLSCWWPARPGGAEVVCCPAGRWLSSLRRCLSPAEGTRDDLVVLVALAVDALEGREGATALLSRLLQARPVQATGRTDGPLAAGADVRRRGGPVAVSV